MQDQELIRSYLQGDHKALETLIQRYLKPIFRCAYQYTHHEHDAEDVTQEAFVKAWKNLKRFDVKKSFKAWIFEIAKNTALDFLNKKKVARFSDFENPDGRNFLLDELADDAPLPQEIFQQTETAGIIQKFMQTLSAKYRLVFLLRYNNGLTFQEIANSLHEPLHTVKSRCRRSVLQLKKFLAPKE